MGQYGCKNPEFPAVFRSEEKFFFTGKGNPIKLFCTKKHPSPPENVVFQNRMNDLDFLK
jgi:hypothetical protein